MGICLGEVQRAGGVWRQEGIHLTGGITEGFMEQVVWEMGLKGWIAIGHWRKTFKGRNSMSKGMMAEKLRTYWGNCY